MANEVGNQLVTDEAGKDKLACGIDVLCEIGQIGASGWYLRVSCSI